VENLKNKGGRPRKELDWKTLDNILQFGARLLDCSDLCEVSEDLIQKRIREKFDCTFSEYRERKMSKMRMKLLQKQYDVAMKGNVALLIWLGKQHLGQKDKHETDLGDNAKQVFELAYKK